MDKDKKTTLAHILETSMCCFLRTINTAMVDTQNEFTGDRAQKVPYDSDAQVPVKHEFSDTFDGKFVGKSE